MRFPLGAAAARLPRWRPRRPGRRLLAVFGLVLAAVGVAVAVANPFGGGPSGGGAAAAATSLAKVTLRPLSSQTQVSGTLGYAGSANVTMPPGTNRSTLRQAQQTYASAQAALRGAESALLVDQRT